MKTTARIGDSFLSIRESENEAFRVMPGWSNEQGTTMSNSVTLEQLNAPTDQELESLRCPKSDIVFVSLAWHGGDGKHNGVVYGPASNEWLERNIEELSTGRKAAVAIHEDEELMLRIPLDEGV